MTSAVYGDDKERLRSVVIGQMSGNVASRLFGTGFGGIPSTIARIM